MSDRRDISREVRDFMITPSAMVERVARNSRRPASRPGSDVISLSSGDPNFETPPHIRQALIDAIEHGHTHYVDNQGDPELRSALAGQLSQSSGTVVSSSEILITHGGSGALAAAILATVNPRDRVLLPEPTYSLYADLVNLVGAEPVYVSQTSDFHLDLDAIKAQAPGARMIVLCHPCNPTGVVYGRSELEAVAELAEQHDMLVLADEAYEHFVYPPVEFVSTMNIPRLRDRLLYCQTFSKTYAMTGWRVGYLVAPPDVAKAAGRVHRTFNSALNAAVQRAALAAVTTTTDWPERMRTEYEVRRRTALELVSQIPGVQALEPSGAFYIFIRSIAGASSDAMQQSALNHGVVIRGGTEYGPSGEGYIRIAFTPSREEIRNGLARLNTALTELAR